MIYYFMLFFSAFIFSCQFLVTKHYQKYKEDNLTTQLTLAFGASVAISIFFFVKAIIAEKSFIFGFSTFTFLITLGIATVTIGNVILGIKVLGVGNISTYSVFMMLGSLILPSFVGIAFYGEKLSFIKIIAFSLMLTAIILTVGSAKNKTSKKAIFYYVGVFIMNGMIAVFFTIHQNHPELTACVKMLNESYIINSDIFMTWYGLSTVLVSFVGLVIIFVCNKIKRVNDIEFKSTNNKSMLKISTKMKIYLFFIPIIYGLINGVGDYIIALATVPNALGSSITFPIINGGTILFSALVGRVFEKEKITLKNAISMIIIVISTILFMFAV